MRYKVFCSNGNDSHHLYFDDGEQAKLIFRMAQNSGMFTYVVRYECYERYNLLEEWADEWKGGDGNG